VEASEQEISEISMHEASYIVPFNDDHHSERFGSESESESESELESVFFLCGRCDETA